MDPQPSAPPVVAVVVTCDPGPWLEDALSALADQDYPNLSVLVIDAASTDDPTARVAAVLPTAYVRRLGAARRVRPRRQRGPDGRRGGVALLLFCHDDVAPAPDAVRVMVEEAFRSNAGVVCPKLVEWDHPDRLLSVGQSADKVGVPSDLVERGELDQEQHDAVRDVFCAPGGCTLVRADLFASLGGFDTGDRPVRRGPQPVVAGPGGRGPGAGGARGEGPPPRGHRERPPATGRRGRPAPGPGRRRWPRSTGSGLADLLQLIHLVRVLPQRSLLTVGQAVVELVDRPPAGGGRHRWRRGPGR